MPERIIIEGNIARWVREEVINEASLESLAPHLTTRLSTTLPVLPQHATRYVSFDPEAGNGIIVVETTPKRHTMVVRHSSHSAHTEDAARRDNDGLSRFNVQLPYQYFAYSFTVRERDGRLSNFTIDRSHLFWAKDPVRSPDDQLWVARCPNVDSGGGICWGSTTSDSSSLSARIDDLVNNFYTTTFNEDLGHLTPFDDSLLRWEADSEDPLAYRNWPMWDGTSRPLSAIHQYLRTAEPTNMAELNPTHVDLPVLPENFTVARAQQWIASLSDGARRRLEAAIASEPIAVEAPVEEVEA